MVARTYKTIVNRSGKSGHLSVLFLVLEENLSALHHWVWCWLWVCHKWPLLCWDMFLLHQLSDKRFFFFYQKWIFKRLDKKILSGSFSASMEMLMCLFSFLLLIQCITLIDLWIFQPSLHFWTVSPLIMVKWSEVKLLSRVQLFATPWSVAYRAPLSMGFSRQEY